MLQGTEDVRSEHMSQLELENWKPLCHDLNTVIKTGMFINLKPNRCILYVCIMVCVTDCFGSKQAAKWCICVPIPEICWGRATCSTSLYEHYGKGEDIR